MRGLYSVVSAIVVASILQGCGAASGGGDPGARALPIGQSCQSIRGELNKLDSRGVPAQVEKASNGGKLSASQRTDVDNYNRLLSQYLGSRCHV